MLLLRREELDEVLEWSREELGNCRLIPLDVGSLHELELGNLNELSEAYHETPRLRSLHLESLQEDCTHLLVDDLSISLHVDVEDDAAEVEGVDVRVPQLIDDGI